MTETSGYSDGYTRFTGTAAEVIAELEERAEGWHHMAGDKKRDRALEAVQSVRDGSFSVRVGQVIYTVVSEHQDVSGDVPDPRNESADSAVVEP